MNRYLKANVHSILIYTNKIEVDNKADKCLRLVHKLFAPDQILFTLRKILIGHETK